MKYPIPMLKVTSQHPTLVSWWNANPQISIVFINGLQASQWTGIGGTVNDDTTDSGGTMMLVLVGPSLEECSFYDAVTTNTTKIVSIPP